MQSGFNFKGIVIHSAEFGTKSGELLASVPAQSGNTEAEAPAIVVVGGGKSAQEYVFPATFRDAPCAQCMPLDSISAYLANEGRKVTVICPDFDAFTAGPKPLPAFIRKSR